MAAHRRVEYLFWIQIHDLFQTTDKGTGGRKHCKTDTTITFQEYFLWEDVWVLKRALPKIVACDVTGIVVGGGGSLHQDPLVWPGTVVESSSSQYIHLYFSLCLDSLSSLSHLCNSPCITPRSSIIIDQRPRSWS